MPAYAHGGLEDAGQDLCAIQDTTLLPSNTRIVGTGLAIELPAGFEAQIRPRSGLAARHAVTVNFGTIDPGYRGELGVIMFNHGTENYTVKKGDKIAQIVISKYEPIEWEEIGELAASERGENGYGSSGR